MYREPGVFQLFLHGGRGPTVKVWVSTTAQRAANTHHLVVRQAEQFVELAMRTSGWKELVRWILSWQPDVKVLVPPHTPGQGGIQNEAGAGNQGG